MGFVAEAHLAAKLTIPVATNDKGIPALYKELAGNVSIDLRMFDAPGWIEDPVTDRADTHCLEAFSIGVYTRGDAVSRRLAE